MPSPTKIHHVHIFSDVNYDKMVDFYLKIFNAEIVRVNPNHLTFISFDDHDRAGKLEMGVIGQGVLLRLAGTGRHHQRGPAQRRWRGQGAAQAAALNDPA